jgi:serine/threonine-protein kinase RsbT
MDSDSGVSPTVAREEGQASGVPEIHVSIRSDHDIVVARQKGRELAAELEFGSVDQTLIATTISELARNIVQYAEHGEIILQVVRRGELQGISVTAQDEGPGIPDTSRVLQGGYSTSRSLGLGLPGAKRLMDEFSIWSEVGCGTRVTVKKWKES